MGAMSARDRILKNRENIAANRSKGMRSYKFKNGVTKLRILPLVDDPSQPFERKFGKTYLKSFDNKQFLGIIDRSITFDEPSDPVRELIFDAMRQAPDQETKDHYRDMLASTRYVFNALILDGDPDQKPNEPVIIEVSETQFDEIMSQFLIWSEDDPDYDLAALKTGHVFSVEKTGSGLDTRYNWQATPKKAPLNAKVLDKAHDLDAWIQSQIEGLEEKALEFMGRLNAAVGIETTIQGPSLTASDSAKQKAKNAASNVGEEAVTSQIEEDIEDAEIEELVEEVEAEAASKQEDDTAAEEPAEEADDEVSVGTTESSDEDDIDSILASLED